MTHDELLAKIDICFAEVPVDYGQADAHNALRAVVELCKPTELDEVYDSTWKEVIIQVIEEELK